MSSPEEKVQLTCQGKIAIITLNVEKKLNALDGDLYYRLSCLMREVAARDEIYITILTGRGRYFSAYARSDPVPEYYRAVLTFVAAPMYLPVLKQRVSICVKMRFVI